MFLGDMTEMLSFHQYVAITMIHNINNKYRTSAKHAISCMLDCKVRPRPLGFNHLKGVQVQME